MDTPSLTILSQYSQSSSVNDVLVWSQICTSVRTQL